MAASRHERTAFRPEGIPILRSRTFTLTVLPRRYGAASGRPVCRSTSGVTVTTRQRGPLSFFVAVLATLVVGLTTASPSAAATVAPAAPVLLSTVVGVDGVTLRWFQGSTTAGTPTSYVVHRRAAGYDADWVVPTGLSPWSYADGGAPVGVDVNYMVPARNSAGDSPGSEQVPARVPVGCGAHLPDCLGL